MPVGINVVGGVAPVLRRNNPTLLGTLTAINTDVQFAIMIPVSTPNGNDLLSITTTGTVTTGTAVLEFSLDGGTTWANISASSQAATFNITGNLTGDTAASSAQSYNVSGLQGAIFRFGFSAGTLTSVGVWALMG